MWFILYMYSNVSFTSSAQIRFADNIARRVNNAYPRVSASKFEAMRNVKSFHNSIFRLNEDLNWMRYKFSNFASHNRGDFVAQWKYLADNIKLQKKGNCQESANLAEIAARVNGINDCQVAEVKLLTADNKTFPLDHAVLLVNDEKRPYIIDAWLGFADSIPNAFKRFQSEFSKFMGLEHSAMQNLVIEVQGKKHVISSDVQEKLKDTFPQLIIDNA